AFSVCNSPTEAVLLRPSRPRPPAPDPAPRARCSLFSALQSPQAWVESIWRSIYDEGNPFAPPLVDFLDPDAVMPPLPEGPAIALSPEDRARVNRIVDIGYLR
ncbi:MAG: hypothetical protein MUQ65_17805, partial [Armatimonadetes bacterium]|nr:hypothetical protein [Armatimonadota bacterium]